MSKITDVATEYQYKETNPKDAVGVKKVPLSTLSAVVMAEVGVAMLEGALKYGRSNYRVAGVRASVYYDASMRHLMSFWEGENEDPDSGLSHVTKAIAGLMVLRDSMIQENWVDDRPPVAVAGWVQELNKKAAALIEKYSNPKMACTEADVQCNAVMDNVCRRLTDDDIKKPLWADEKW